MDSDEYKRLRKNLNDAIKKKLIEDKLRNKIQEILKSKKEKAVKIAEKYDVSKNLPQDALAKLNLLYGDIVIIPKDKLKDYVEEVK